jgi:hypothetical protein
MVITEFNPKAACESGSNELIAIGEDTAGTNCVRPPLIQGTENGVYA